MAKPLTFTENELDIIAQGIGLVIASAERNSKDMKRPKEIRDLYNKVGDQAKTTLRKVQETA